MADFPNTSGARKELLKHMILQLHSGEAPDEVRRRLVGLLKDIPYNEVVQVEQELINEGLPEEEVLKFCDIHTQVLEGHIDVSKARKIPAGHPVDTFKKENKELIIQVGALNRFYEKIRTPQDLELESYLIQLKGLFNNIMDVEKHYQRKENLLFPYLEKYNITGPPKVMWGKHDETRELLRTSIEALNVKGEITIDEIGIMIDMVLKPASQSVADMIMKEEEILFPMSMDKLTDTEWYEISQQSIEIGYCLYDPEIEWKPEGVETIAVEKANNGLIQLPSGKLTVHELINIFNTLPVEVTFIDNNDKVKYFSQGKHQIFKRNRAVLGRDVRLCHPPKSVHIVEQILNDFKTGKQDQAAFWIEMNGIFVYIVYYAVKDEENNYVGTMEIVQDITQIKKLEGEQRLLNYSVRSNEE